MPYFSIVPVYSTAAFLGDRLRSLVNQTFDDIEINVVDDASPDGAFEIASKYAKCNNRAKVHSHQENKGLVSCSKSSIIIDQSAH